MAPGGKWSSTLQFPLAKAGGPQSNPPMAFADFPAQQQGVTLLQRSLERGRLAHAYLFTGDDLDELEGMARTLAKTLNCQQPRRIGGAAVDCCDACSNCVRVNDGNFPDLFFVRPESKLRLLKIGQFTRRDDSPPVVMNDFIHMKPYEGGRKVGVIVEADRMNENACNSFLKTLEEPPANSVIILLTTQPQQILDTIQSRCLRLTFGGTGARKFAPEHVAWLGEFTALLAAPNAGLLARYRVLGQLLARLAAMKETLSETLTARSPLQRYTDAEPKLQEKWEEELTAAIEAEYRRQRADLLLTLQWWLRDVWLRKLGAGSELVAFPDLTPTAETVSARLSPGEALENLRVIEQTQRLLRTNVNEPLALEVGLLKLRL